MLEFVASSDRTFMHCGFLYRLRTQKCKRYISLHTKPLYNEMLGMCEDTHIVYEVYEDTHITYSSHNAAVSMTRHHTTAAQWSTGPKAHFSPDVTANLMQ